MPIIRSAKRRQQLAGQQWKVDRVPIYSATALVTVHSAAHVADARGALVRIRPELGEDARALSAAVGEIAAGVRVEAAPLEGLPEIDADADETPRQLAERRVAEVSEELRDAVAKLVDDALTGARL